MHEALSASIVFSSMTVFDILREMIGLSMYLVTSAVTAKVSLDRVNTFLDPAKVRIFVHTPLHPSLISHFYSRTSSTHSISLETSSRLASLLRVTR